MSQCKTESGRYRCKYQAGHAGECEVEAAEYTPMPSLAKREPSLAKRVEVLEAQVASLQLAMPRGIPR